MTQVITERLHIERLCTERLCTERLHTERLCMERLHTERLGTERLCIERLCTERLCTERLCTERLCTERMCIERLHIERLWTESLRTEAMHWAGSCGCNIPMRRYRVNRNNKISRSKNSRWWCNSAAREISHLIWFCMLNLMSCCRVKLFFSVLCGKNSQNFKQKS